MSFTNKELNEVAYLSKQEGWKVLEEKIGSVFGEQMIREIATSTDSNSRKELADKLKYGSDVLMWLFSTVKQIENRNKGLDK